MGNWCCPASSPCDNVEERSGLLQDAAKGQATPAEIGVVVGFQHDTDADDVRKPVDHIETKEKEEVVTVQVKQSALPKEHGEIAQTTENEPIQTAARQPEETSPSTNSGYIENFSLTTQDGAIEITVTENGPLEAERCTLDLPPKECARDTGEVSTEIKGVLAEETATVIPKEHSDGITPEAEDRCSEVATLKAEIFTVTEHITPETVDDDGSTEVLNKAVDQPSRKSPCGNVDTSLTDTQLTPEVCKESSVSNHDENCIDSASTGDLPQLPSSSLASPSGSVIQGIDSENQSPAFHIEDSQEDRGHDSPEPSPGAEVTDPKQNGVAQNTTGLAKEPVPASSSRAEKSQNSIEEKEVDLKSELIGLNEVTALEDLVQEVEDEVVSEAKEQEDEDQENEAEEEEEMEESAALEAVTGVEMGKEKKEEDHQGPSTSADMEVEVLPVREQDGSVEMLGNSDDQDLYQGEEEISPGPDKKAGPEPLFQITFPKVEDRCSLAPTVDVLSYSEKEWKGNTAKSALIRKGYMELSQRFGSLRRVRGDNYCALRATLFQVLSHSTHLPAWLQDEDISMWPEELETREGLIGQWMFPSECRQGEGTEDAVQQLKRYMELLQNRWQAAVSCSSAEERQRLCERLFQGGEEELGLLEALKLLMLGRAAEIHTCMQEGGDVPIFCWLLFARDDSDCPRTFLSNHLSQVGFSGGLEQVEMFLLGHALQCTIQVYRLYMADTEEFVTYYPNDHKDDWPCVCLVTEDDRHYNVPVGEITGGLQVPEELTAADDH